MTETPQSSGGWAGKAVLILIVWVVLAGGAYWLLVVYPGRGAPKTTNPTEPARPATGGDLFDAPKPPPDPAPPAADRATVGIAYGTEKRRWLENALEEFNKTPDGKRYRIDLIPMGSLEGAQAVLAGDERIDVWSPASSMYRRVFESEWQVKRGNAPILTEETLALSPMVFVMWAERYDAFVAKYGKVNFKTIEQALNEPGGWAAIAEKPEWGLFKFAHTNPGQSNSGLMTLVLTGYDYHDKTASLSMSDILDPAYQAWLKKLEAGVSGLSNSTANMMREMVLKGPSAFDAVMVYENVAIDFLKNAEGRWGKIRVVYPPVNMWNDNPYYVLDVPWSTAEQRAGAKAFLAFLMSEPVQTRALDHGFRPGNAAVPVKFAESPFVRYAPYGVRIDLTGICENPAPEVLTNLLAGWQRTAGGR